MERYKQAMRGMQQVCVHVPEKTKVHVHTCTTPSQDNPSHHTHPPDVGDQYAVDASQLNVDLQAEVGKGLGRGTVHVLQLHTLRGHAQLCVPYTLHLS